MRSEGGGESELQCERSGEILVGGRQGWEGGGQEGKTYPNLSISLQVFCKSVKVADKAIGGQYTFMYRDTCHTVNSDRQHNYSDSQHNNSDSHHNCRQ